MRVGLELIELIKCARIEIGGATIRRWRFWIPFAPLVYGAAQDTCVATVDPSWSEIELRQIDFEYTHYAETALDTAKSARIGKLNLRRIGGGNTQNLDCLRKRGECCEESAACEALLLARMRD